MKKTSTVALLVGLGLAMQAPAGDFYAYYTALDYTQPDVRQMLARIPASAMQAFRAAGVEGPAQVPGDDPAFSLPRPGQVRWGRYADVVVQLAPSRRLVFSRATGYRPYLQTPKGRFPFKPLVEYIDDGLCLCSYVRIIEQSPQRILIHWRHVPDPTRVVMTETIHEYFTITPDGRMRREIRLGTPRLDDFNDSANVTVQHLALTEEGIVELSLSWPSRSNKPSPAVAGAPLRGAVVASPVAWFKFDDGLGPHRDQTVEAVTGTACTVGGNKALWKKGVSGTALACDGYFSKVTLPRARLGNIGDQLTVEAWVALGAYPWNDAGIVHQSAGQPISPEDYKHGYRDPYTYRPWKLTGYMLGIDPYGRPIFKINGRQVGGGVVEHEQLPDRRDMLPTYRWVHLAGTYGNGRMTLYVNGREAASRPASGPIRLPDRDVLIGLNGDPQRISDPVSHSRFAANNNLPLVYGIEGLIDEVRIYDRALSADQVRRSFEAFCPPADALNQPDLQRRILPGQVTGRPADKFGASYMTLKYHELWDNLWRPSRYRDVVVRFDTLPCSVVFWQGTNFGSGWVTENNKWMSDQSWEIGGPHGCAEHMADKRGRFNRVRILENTDARVVVHWRYASIDVGYVFPGVAVWADEYYTIYPDGVGVRYLEGINGGWQDTQFLSQPGTTCLDNVSLTAITVATLDGRSADLTWQPPNRVPANPLKDACIKRINFKSKWKVFDIYRLGARIGTWGAQEQSKHTPDPFAGPWNHWPVGLNPSDGRYAVADDRLTHAALGGAGKTGNIIMYGFTDKPVSSLVPLARSWNLPPRLDRAEGCDSQGYDQTQRAYRLTAQADRLSFVLEASEQSPICNPCFVVRNWPSDKPSRLLLDGRVIAGGKRLRQGIVRDTQGKRMLVAWVELESVSPVQVTLLAR